MVELVYTTINAESMMIDDMIDRWIDNIQMNDVTIPSIAPTAANDDDGDDGDDANIKLP